MQGSSNDSKAQDAAKEAFAQLKLERKEYDLAKGTVPFKNIDHGTNLKRATNELNAAKRSYDQAYEEWLENPNDKTQAKLDRTQKLLDREENDYQKAFKYSKQDHGIDPVKAKVELDAAKSARDAALKAFSKNPTDANKKALDAAEKKLKTETREYSLAVAFDKLKKASQLCSKASDALEKNPSDAGNIKAKTPARP